MGQCKAGVCPTERFIACMSVLVLSPDLHPLTRRNGLVDQVEFLGLVHTFATVSRSSVQHFMPHPLKKGTDTH